MRLPLLVILATFLLAACGQSEPPAKGEAGPPGPAGPPGAAGPGSARPRRSARFQRQRTGDQGHHSAMRSNVLRRELRSE